MLNTEYQCRDCVATCNLCTEEGELDILTIIDCCDGDCLPEINTPDWGILETEIDAVFDLFQSKDLINHVDPHADGLNTHGEWIK